MTCYSEAQSIRQHVHLATKTMAGVPYQALPLRFFVYKIACTKKVRKGEGEPGDEVNNSQWLLVSIKK